MCADRSQLAQSAWDAVERFVAGTDPYAATVLYRILHDSAEEGGVHVLTLPAPQLLQHALQAPDQGTNARLLVIAILNHLFCTRLLPLTLQRPADRRATGLAELEDLYLGVLLTLPLNAAVERQLVPCAAMLLLLNHPSALSAARDRFLCDPGADQPAMTPLLRVLRQQRYLSVFVSLCDLLTDRRVPLGPVQRARQLRDVQQCLDMVLTVTLAEASPSIMTASPSVEPSVSQALVRAVGRGASLLLERATEEPLDMCPRFWEQLGTHPVWQRCLAGAQDGDEDATETVCHVLRCLTVMEPASEQLLTAALNGALHVAQPKARCELITAALEASTEAVILHYDPAHPLFQLLSRAAEALLAPLHADRRGNRPSSADDDDDDADDECDRLACEGVAVLAQTLTPLPLPEMEPTDDPEDYASMTEEIQGANASKAHVLGVMRAFFDMAQQLLFRRLADRVSEDDYERIAQYVAQCLDDDDDTAVAFDSACVAYYSTYERLHALLGALPVEATNALQQGSATLAVVGCSAQAVLWFVQHQLARVLQLAVTAPSARPPVTGTPLLPVLFRRFTIATLDSSGGFMRSAAGPPAAWHRDALIAMAAPLLTHLQLTCRHASLLAATGCVMDTAVVLLAALTREATLAEAQGLRQAVFPTAWQWLGQVSEAAAALDMPSRQHSQAVATHLGDWLVCGLYVPASLDAFVADAVTLAAPFQLEVLSAVPATSVHDIAAVLDLVPPTLQWMGEARHDAVLDRVGRRLAAHAARLASTSAATADALSAVLRQNAGKLPVLCPALLVVVTHCDGLPSASETALEVVRQAIWGLGNPADVATTDLVWILEERVCLLLAGAPSSATVDTAHALLQSLLQPSSSFTAGDNVRRLHLIARLGRMLVEGGRSAAPPLLSCYTEALQRLLEVISASSLEGFSSASTPAASRSTRRDEDDDDTTMTSELLQEMAAFGRCAAAANPTTPDSAATSPWLARLGHCEDDFERLAVLKDFVQ